MKILQIIPSINPADGGPVEHACIMATEHAAEGHQTIFVTLDDPQEDHVRQFPFVLYATGPTRGLLKSSANFSKVVAQQAASADVAIVHGLWNYASIGGFGAFQQANLPWVIFPHGMLDPYFRKIKPVKHMVKQVYWWLWQGRMMSGAKYVLFTCQEEQRLASNAFLGHQPYCPRVVAYCAADLASAQGAEEDGWQYLEQKMPSLRKRNYWLFLSRLHPKKAIDNFIAAYAEVAAGQPCPDLVIAGPDSVGWKANLIEQTHRLGVADRIHFPGMLRDAAKVSAFLDAEAFVLPSHQENFGIVVAEALSVGTPVLISDKVNIWREVVEAGAGMSEPDTVIGTKRLLERFLALSPSAKSKMQAHARSCYEQRFSATASAADVMAVLQEVANQDSRSDAKHSDAKTKGNRAK